jgi:hypothetical protein
VPELEREDKDATAALKALKAVTLPRMGAATAAICEKAHKQ